MHMDSSFWLAIATVIGGILIFMLRTIFASKCREVNLLWGCVRIDREVDLEMRDIRQSPAKQASVPNLQPLSNIPRSRPNSCSSSPRSVCELEKIDLEKQDL